MLTPLKFVPLFVVGTDGRRVLRLGLGLGLGLLEVDLLLLSPEPSCALATTPPRCAEASKIVAAISKANDRLLTFMFSVSFELSEQPNDRVHLTVRPHATSGFYLSISGNANALRAATSLKCDS